MSDLPTQSGFPHARGFQAFCSFLLFVFTSQRVKHWKRLLIPGGCGASVLGNNKILTGRGRKQPPPTGAALRLEGIISKAPSNFSYCMIFLVMVSLSAEVNSQQLMAETSECLKALEGLEEPTCLDVNRFETP